LQQCWCHFILSSLVFFFFSHFFLYSLLQWIETYIYVHTQLTWLSTHMYIILYIYNMIYKWFIHSHSIWFFSFRKENITIDERCKRKTKEMIWQTADANVVDSSITSSWKREERMPVYIYTNDDSVVRLIMTCTYACIGYTLFFQNDVQKVTLSISSIDKSINSSWWISSRAILIRKIISMPLKILK
jgi:hypothetical protein